MFTCFLPVTRFLTNLVQVFASATNEYKYTLLMCITKTVYATYCLQLYLHFIPRALIIILYFPLVFSEPISQLYWEWKTVKSWVSFLVKFQCTAVRWRFMGTFQRFPYVLSTLREICPVIYEKFANFLRNKLKTIKVTACEAGHIEIYFLSAIEKNTSRGFVNMEILSKFCLFLILIWFFPSVLLQLPVASDLTYYSQ